MSIDFAPALADPFSGLDEKSVAGLGSLKRGKVRDVVDLGDSLALISTDRVSAFDHVLGTVPYRGQVLNELSAWWFEQTADIVGHHLLSVPDPNLAVVRRCRPLPVEVVVRGRLSGSTSTSLWTAYARGEREIYGLRFADGMAKNDPLTEPVLTPTTKADQGLHDEPISESGVVAAGLVEAPLWKRVRSTALALFARGCEVAERAGLVLVDTKYEFGIDDAGDLRVIDEVHTPDSSRYWRRSSMEQLRQAGMEPENLDKEHIRLAYARSGYSGDGPPPALSPQLAVEAAEIYIEAFEALTGRRFQPAGYPAAPRVSAALAATSGALAAGLPPESARFGPPAERPAAAGSQGDGNPLSDPGEIGPR